MALLPVLKNYVLFEDNFRNVAEITVFFFAKEEHKAISIDGINQNHELYSTQIILTNDEKKNSINN